MISSDNGVQTTCLKIGFTTQNVSIFRIFWSVFSIVWTKAGDLQSKVPHAVPR